MHKSYKTQTEIEAEQIYKQYLDFVISKIGSNETTSDQLEQFGFTYLPRGQFKGCFPRDMIPKLNYGESCIVNEDTHKGPGIHWMSLYHGSTLIFYDSFGRTHKKVKVKVKAKDADPTDREQKFKEMNCGARALAFLMVCYFQSENKAILI